MSENKPGGVIETAGKALGELSQPVVVLLVLVALNIVFLGFVFWFLNGALHALAAGCGGAIRG